MRLSHLTIAALALAAPRLATAQGDGGDDAYAFGSAHARPPSSIGVGLTVGGGVVGFTDQALRDAVSTMGGLWDVRLSIGTHVPLGLDLSYVGSATDMRTLTGSATLIGTAAEAALRVNLSPPLVVAPYLFGGVGWQRYAVHGSSFELADSGVSSSDELITFPLGVALSYRTHGLVVDLRGVYRVAIDQGLVRATSGTGFAPMDTWELSGAVGYEL